MKIKHFSVLFKISGNFLVTRVNMYNTNNNKTTMAIINNSAGYIHIHTATGVYVYNLFECIWGNNKTVMQIEWRLSARYFYNYKLSRHEFRYILWAQKYVTITHIIEYTYTLLI